VLCYHYSIRFVNLTRSLLTIDNHQSTERDSEKQRIVDTARAASTERSWGECGGDAEAAAIDVRGGYIVIGVQQQLMLEVGI
jgi:hypothetical protein